MPSLMGFLGSQQRGAIPQVDPSPWFQREPLMLPRTPSTPCLSYSIAGDSWREQAAQDNDSGQKMKG